MFGLLNKRRLLNAEIEIEKLRLENEHLQKLIRETEAAIQIIATNQAYLASEVSSLTPPASTPSMKDPLDEYLKQYGDDGNDDDGGGYLN